MSVDVGVLLERSFGLNLPKEVGLKTPSLVETIDPGLAELEGRVVKNIKTSGSAVCPLNHENGAKLLAALGPGCIVKLALPYRNSDGTPRQVFAVLGPKTNYDKKLVEITYLGRGAKSLIEQGIKQPLWIPEQLDPTPADKITSKPVNERDVMTYLSYIYQVTARACLDPNLLEAGALDNKKHMDAKHLVAALQAVNTGTVAYNVMKDRTLKEQAEASCKWSGESRLSDMISAQDPKNPENDLLHVPQETFTISFDKGLLAAVVFEREWVDEAGLEKGHLLPRLANTPNALQLGILEGFNTIRQKPQAIDNLEKNRDQGFLVG